MKKVIISVLAVLALLVIASGCVSLTPNQATLREFETLKQEYAPTAFPTNTSVLSDYISELSVLRTRSSLSVANVVDAELNSANAFYYYNLALSEFNKINFSSCDAKTVNQTKSFVALTKNHSENASTIIQIINSAEKAYLNPNQRELVEYYAQSAESIKTELQDGC
jgi:hypothetical protein